MPEIGEVARVVHYLRKNLLNKTLKKVVATTDDIVFGKVGTSAAEIEKHLTGKKVIDVGQQGKYFWMIMSSPPHPVMHLGMSGWFKFQNEHTYYYKPKPGDEEKNQEWPPKFWKFHLEAEGDKKSETVRGAFVDMRRLARVRLVDCEGKEIRQNSPLKENGPDPVIDKHIVTLQWLTEKCHKKKVPIKAMLLDQANISGIGNWVGDEIMYHSKIHPEQYANTLEDAQIKQLHESIHYICGTACELLSDSDKFPEDWLFKHRWGKGKKNATHTLPNGEKIVFLTVGGRTSAVVPSVQKKTGPVAKDVDESEADVGPDGQKDVKPKKAKTKKRKAEESEESDAEEEEVLPTKTTARGRKAAANGVKKEAEVASTTSGTTDKKKPAKRGKKSEVKTEDEEGEVVAEDEVKPMVKSKLAARGKKVTTTTPKTTAATTTAKKNKPVAAAAAAQNEDSGRRRSTRTRK